MKIQLAPELIEKLKKQNVRIRNSFKEALKLFSLDPYHAKLDNHELHREWEGFRSIDVTADWRAIYEEVESGDYHIAYFVAVGTHKELYRNKK